MRTSAMKILCAAATAATLGACATTPAPPAPLAYAPPPAGLVVDYGYVANGKGDPSKRSSRHEIVGNDGDVVLNVVTDSPEGTVRENRTLRAIVTTRLYQRGAGIAVEEVETDKVRSLWPLAPGRKASSSGRSLLGRGRTENQAQVRLRQTGTIDYSFEILRRENITVPAGTFDAMVVRRVSTVRDMAGKVTLVSDKTYWMAVELGGWLVRLDTVNKRPGRPDLVARLIAIEVTRPQAAK